ncbi:MAG: HipA domain-containing protein [Kiritimatiellae bacterium]|nr:HipA domain-containing protein [Kiritimatiellia bacterium]
MSISGVQDKISVRLERGALVPVDTAGEYILKPVPSRPLPRFGSDVPANEHVTMQIAAQVFGIPTAANACVYLQDDSMAYVVRRFDRRDGEKVPQEDFCQLSSRSPESHGNEHKYDGTCEEMGRILRAYCTAYVVEVEKLFRLMVFNYVFSNGDAHLKNFSLCESPYGDYVLTPAYDLVCTSMHIPNESRTAMDLFDEFESPFYARNGFYGAEDFLHLANLFDIQPGRAKRILATMPQARDRVTALINRSFMSDDAKADYAARYEDRLRAIRVEA